MRIKHIPTLLMLFALAQFAGCADTPDYSNVDHLRLIIDNGSEKILFPTTDLAANYRNTPRYISVPDLPVWLQTGGHDALPILTFSEYGYVNASSIRMDAYLDNGNGHSVSRVIMNIPFANAPANEPQLSVNLDEYVRRDVVSYSLDPSIKQTAQIGTESVEAEIATGEFDFTLCRTEAQLAKTCDVAGNRKQLHIEFRWAIQHGNFISYPLTPEGTPNAPVDLGVVPALGNSALSGRQTAGEGSYFKLTTAKSVDLEIQFYTNPNVQNDAQLLVYQDAKFTSELCRASALNICLLKTTGNTLYLKVTTPNPRGVFFSLNVEDRTPYPEQGTIDLRKGGELRYQGMTTGRNAAIMFAVDPQKTYTVKFFDDPTVPVPINGQPYLFDLQELADRFNTPSCKDMATLHNCVSDKLGAGPFYDQPSLDLPTLCSPDVFPYTCSVQAPSGTLVVYFEWFYNANGLPFMLKLEEGGGAVYRNEGSLRSPLAVNDGWDGQVAAGTSFYTIATIPNQIYALNLQTKDDPYYADHLIIGTDAWPYSVDPIACDYANQCVFRATRNQTLISVTVGRFGIATKFRLDMRPDNDAIVSERVRLEDNGEPKLSTTGILDYRGSVGIGPSTYSVDTIPGAIYVVTTTSETDTLIVSTAHCENRFISAHVSQCVFRAVSSATDISVRRQSHFVVGEHFQLNVVRDDKASITVN